MDLPVLTGGGRLGLTLSDAIHKDSFCCGPDIVSRSRQWMGGGGWRDGGTRGGGGVSLMFNQIPRERIGTERNMVPLARGHTTGSTHISGSRR